MTLWEKLRVLDVDNGEAARSDEEYELREAWNAERVAEMPRLMCCKEGGVLFAHRKFDEEDKVVGLRWSLYLSEHPYESYPQRRTELKFCPFCATPVPKLVKKAVPPPHLCDDEGQDGYCRHCGERCGTHGSCICSYPEAAWEVER